MAGATLPVGAGQARDRPADTGTIAATRGGVVIRGLGQSYCIGDPSMATPDCRRVCHSLAEWQVQRINPRRMPRL